jgi:hypothetical protein
MLLTLFHILLKNISSGCIPESIGKLKTLADFRLKDNDITG